MVKVNIKWNKQVFSDIELDQNESVETFKTQLWTLTCVPVQRQKLMARGAWPGVLKDDTDLSKCKIKEGQQIMLMGSAEVVQAPAEKVVFLEDMTEEEVAKTGAVLPAGMVNLGNTCYMNSTLECLRYVPELREALKNSSSSTNEANPASKNFTNALNETYNQLDSTTESLPPMLFVQVLRSMYPQFAQQGPRGGYMQQDAEELYSAVQSTLAQNLTERYCLPELGGASNFIDALFGLEVEETLTCEECPEEPPVVRTDLIRKLVCNIQGGAGSTLNISHLHEGVQLGFEGTIEKNSEILGRNAVWKKTQRIKRLPRYICVQFMRFYWKATPESRDHTGVKCKIMKPVSFPGIMDVYNFCNEDLKSILGVTREKDSDEMLVKSGEEEKKTGESNEEKKEERKEEPKKEDDSVVSTMDVEVEEGEDADALKAALALSMQTDESRGLAGPGLPSDFKGNYELFGVVTHKGREADGGHYMGWVKQEGSGDKWFVFDDADVSETTEEEVMKLKGGGDWHMAYLTFYRFKN
mmetsp:Transcript_5254/g.7263  ORF Transcript_5254/g.7263 Transcript_5254/m.7263 type:complete len:526 (-) Transcript_5254:361-1938(-)|eukprot:CAMPEP_0117753046 /NCGR_PEP_ID=MMETSP0947-20121206/11987_1 /TAXON_ID=44440 /ORGANISM="Chattonella subsalsa, Strain CCMP2191" /LENGTH=525 /DNA_ID=CAMNT_0005571843 /DNA_START=46 /DNA_END=1623 /DNA_ORIENTATION=+